MSFGENTVDQMYGGMRGLKVSRPKTGQRRPRPFAPGPRSPTLSAPHV
jgi:hypothetical protein